jgi:hypothetical protein
LRVEIAALSAEWDALSERREAEEEARAEAEYRAWLDSLTEEEFAAYAAACDRELARVEALYPA